MFNIVPAIAILCRSGCLGHNQQPTWQHRTLNLFMSKTKLHLVTLRQTHTRTATRRYTVARHHQPYCPPAQQIPVPIRNNPLPTSGNCRKVLIMKLLVFSLNFKLFFAIPQPTFSSSLIHQMKNWLVWDLVEWNKYKLFCSFSFLYFVLFIPHRLQRIQQNSIEHSIRWWNT